MSIRAYIHGPDKAEVIALRLMVQDHYGVGVGAAQDRCAEAVCSTRRAWQQWEGGQRRMHPAMWQLAQLRTGTHSLWTLSLRKTVGSTAAAGS